MEVRSVIQYCKQIIFRRFAMKLFSKKTIAFAFSLFAAGALFAQQHITNFGVVDTTKVYEQFFRNSSAVKAYEEKRAAFQEEISRRADEIRSLQTKLQEAQDLGMDAEVKSYQDSIRIKSSSLKTYTQQKNTELNNIKNNLSNNNEFYKNLNRTIKKVAENEGLSMVINLQQSNSILWYSPAVDITDKVIESLEQQ